MLWVKKAIKLPVASGMNVWWQQQGVRLDLQPCIIRAELEFAVGQGRGEGISPGAD